MSCTGTTCAFDTDCPLFRDCTFEREAAESWDGPTDSDGQPCRFLNYYECPRCGNEWTDQWSAMCDDDCPACGCRHISPVKSEDQLT